METIIHRLATFGGIRRLNRKTIVESRKTAAKLLKVESIHRFKKATKIERLDTNIADKQSVTATETAPEGRDPSSDSRTNSWLMSMKLDNCGRNNSGSIRDGDFLIIYLPVSARFSGIKVQNIVDTDMKNRIYFIRILRVVSFLKERLM